MSLFDSLTGGGGLSGGDAGSGASTGDVNIPGELFQFPEYPSALAAAKSGGLSFNVSPVTVALALLAAWVIKKKGGK